MLFLEDNIFELHNELKNKIYQHSHCTSFYIQDPKPRHIHKASVRDRVLHHAVFRVLYPIFDPSFIFDSYSCRLDKGTHRAVNRLEQFARRISQNNTRICFILKCDIRRYFDSIDHRILVNLIEKRIEDDDALWLIKEIINSFQTERGKGLPLGNSTSQLFANIYLNELDKLIKHKLRIKHYLRYCDDFVMLSADKDYLTVLISKTQPFLKSQLRLSLHPNKIILKKWRQGIDFLGYVSFPYYRILRAKTKKRMLKKIKQRIQELKQGKITEKSLNQTFRSYLGILKHCNPYKLRQRLERYLGEKLDRA